MRAGDKVKVYQKPMTDEEYEGDAVLVRLVEGEPESIDKPDEDQYWVLRFLDKKGKPEPDCYDRFVYPRHRITA